MTDKTNRPRGLGRGLSALMADVAPAAGDAPADRERRPDLRVPVERLRPNPRQPRRSFPEAEMEELVASIREKGIIQPLIVRPDPEAAGTYEIVAGERRWRAAQRAELHDLPVIVRDYSDTEALEVAIIENIQRTDLNPIDEAEGYRQLMERFGHTQDQIATALGRSRSHIANQLRLLTLPDSVRDLVVGGRLSAGHARALVGNPKAEEYARDAVARNLSVREVEALVRQGRPPRARKSPRGGATAAKDADTLQIERELAAALGMAVSIDPDPGRESGRLTLRYRTLAQLDDLLRVLSGG
jgi:ParB family chromosome partitioning protein